ncbi:MAG: hypothetical protein AB1774_05075, partial [Bacillota bacterium]
RDGATARRRDLYIAAGLCYTLSAVRLLGPMFVLTSQGTAALDKELSLQALAAHCDARLA